MTDNLPIVKALGLKINDINEHVSPFVEAHELEALLRDEPERVIAVLELAKKEKT